MLQPVVRVGEWLVTPSVNQISRKGRQLTLEPRLIDLLVFFARHPGEVLSRDELIENVWTRNVVTSHVVTQSISELRKSLKDGDDVSLEYIATVPKRGYKLTVPVIWCTEEGEELAPSMEALTPSPSTAVPAPPAAGAPSDVSVPLRHRLLPWPARRQAASASLPPWCGGCSCWRWAPAWRWWRCRAWNRGRRSTRRVCCSIRAISISTW